VKHKWPYDKIFFQVLRKNNFFNGALFMLFSISEKKPIITQNKRNVAKPCNGISMTTELIYCPMGQRNMRLHSSLKTHF
jgi:hypothetical protein